MNPTEKLKMEIRAQSAGVAVKKTCLLLLVLLPVAAQELRVPCEPSAGTLRLLEAVPPPHDTAIPYEQRVGALRKLASQHPADFFIQRAYQDSFRHNRWLHIPISPGRIST
jgi:hypothetical protein